MSQKNKKPPSFLLLQQIATEST